MPQHATNKEIVLHKSKAWRYADTPRGISLLVVIIVSSLMLVAALALGGFALSTLKNTQTRSDAVQGLYNAESAFACVKYWLGRDYRNFTNDTSSGTHNAGGISCDDGTTWYNFTDGSTANGDYDTSTGIATFMIGNTRVEVHRDTTVLGRFVGEVYVYGASIAGGGTTAERFQKYDLSIISQADFMFVVDRSGSIGGVRTPSAAVTGDWALLVAALTDGIAYLSTRIPAPHIGAISFGKGIDDMGTPVNGPGCSTSNCLREPDVPLTDPSNTPNNLPYNDGSLNDPTDDDLGGVRVGTPDTNFTNLSLGISMAGLELLGRYYPADTVLGNPGYSAGSFESDVANGIDINPGLYETHTRGRADAPKYMIIITDGEPNALVSFTTDTYLTGIVDSNNDIPLPFLEDFKPGDSKLFKTRTPAGGDLIDDGQYMWCNDLKNNNPIFYLGNSYVTNNEHYHVAMCNATQIRDALDKLGIQFAVIAVGLSGSGSDLLEDWLRERIATDERLFRVATGYGDVYDALNQIIEEIALRESK